MQPHYRASQKSSSEWTAFTLLSPLSWSYHVPQPAECLSEAGLGVGKPSASGNLLGDSSLQLPRGEAADWGAGLRWLGPRSSSCSSSSRLGFAAVHPRLSDGVNCPREVGARREGLSRPGRAARRPFLEDWVHACGKGLDPPSTVLGSGQGTGG